MVRRLNRFLTDERGAVTVDWVVLTAAIMALNIFAIVNLIESGAVVNANRIDEVVEEASNY